MLAVAHPAVDAGVRLPNELTLLGKTLLNLDEVGGDAGARFRRQESMRRNANELMMERMRRSVTPSSTFRGIARGEELRRAAAGAHQPDPGHGREPGAQGSRSS